MARILVVDDDPALLRALRIALQNEGHEFHSATTGERGISEVSLVSPDVVVLDLGLPDTDGLAVCTRIREWTDVPIIVLSATDSEARKVAALDAGADDYVTKPFSMAELEARIRAALRHGRTSAGDQPAELVVGTLEVDLVHREARLGGAPMHLTAREFDLLAYLARYAGKVCTHQMILDAVWGHAYAHETQYLHSYIHRLRQKLSKDATGVRIETAPGIGYVLRDAAPPDGPMG
jgi:two-component system KDP operon response regulator KdpE